MADVLLDVLGSDEGKLSWLLSWKNWLHRKACYMNYQHWSLNQPVSLKNSVSVGEDER